jgi:hypothetical protein
MERVYVRKGGRGKRPMLQIKRKLNVLVREEGCMNERRRPHAPLKAKTEI